MKNISTLTLLVLLFSASSINAQQQVAVVDMGKIFREHIAFKGQITALQKEVESFKLTIQADRVKIQTESEALAAIPKSSPNFRTKEAEIAKMAADMQLGHNMKNRDFMEKEAKVYYQTYVQVLTTVQDFCRRNNVSLVVRFTGDQIDPNNRASVLAGVNNVVVFQNRKDITGEIIKIINGGASVANQNNGATNR